MENKEVLCEDILEIILRKVPFKSRTRFKCVSKSWNCLITNLRHSSPPTTTSGVAFSSKKPSETGSYQLTLLHLQEEDQGETCSMKTRTVSITHNLPWLIDSCNGLLLFGAKDGNSLSYHIFNPLKDQWRKLPSAHDFLRPASASLVFDGVQQNFKVICQFWEEADLKNGKITYQIFSSKTCEWREYIGKIHNSSLLLSKDFNHEEWFCPGLYREGQVYWIWSIFLLVFYEKKETFELMELPKNKPGMSIYFAKRLWESEMRLHYCDATFMGFYIWEYVEKLDPDKSMWFPKGFIQLDGLVSRNFEVFDESAKRMELDWISLSPFLVKPCASNEDLEILYFQLPGYIASFSFEKKKMIKVQSDNAIGRNMHDNVHPFVFRDVDLLS